MIKYLRVHADFENIKKIREKNIKQLIMQVRSLQKDLLAPIDTLEMALSFS